jgi:[acyl-carrier-protein] S-malonyltransferase
MLAVLCGGQGELSAEIFDLMAERPEVTEIFATAAELLVAIPAT